ncbi:MAG: hypothetical protein H6569_02040 [Lewinellaceae bacterium]|nr:hypothetical protein [Lewinellaceae bacterium]
MKNASILFAATLALFLGFNISLNAQKTTTWKGGAPGRAQDWNCPKNWSDGRVPDTFSDVVIPDVSTTSFAAPIIKNGAFEVNSLRLLANATLRVERSGQLAVLNDFDDNMDTRGLQIKGSIVLPGEVLQDSVAQLQGDRKQ